MAKSAGGAGRVGRAQLSGLAPNDRTTFTRLANNNGGGIKSTGLTVSSANRLKKAGFIRDFQTSSVGKATFFSYVSYTPKGLAALRALRGK